RLTDYQDEAYATDYLDRLETIRDLAAQYGRCGYLLLCQTGRSLALWIAYEDAARVADLKIRRTRFERVHKDARVDAAQLLQINEFLHPAGQGKAKISRAGLGHV